MIMQFVYIGLDIIIHDYMAKANLITYSATVKCSSGHWRTACSLLSELPKRSLEANIILRGAVMKSLQTTKAPVALSIYIHIRIL